MSDENPLLGEDMAFLDKTLMTQIRVAEKIQMGFLYAMQMNDPDADPKDFDKALVMTLTHISQDPDDPDERSEYFGLSQDNLSEFFSGMCMALVSGDEEKAKQLHALFYMLVEAINDEEAGEDGQSG